MFGLLTKQDAQITVESNGGDIGTKRVFYFYLGSNHIHAMRDGFLEFDIDKVGATPNEVIFGELPISYGPEATQSLVSNLNDLDFPGDSLFIPPYTLKASDRRGWIYSTDEILSPPTRKYRATISRPETLEFFSLSAPLNNQFKSNTNNTARNTLKLLFNNCHELKHIILNESYVSTLNLQIESLRKLETFSLTEWPNLSSITGKLPSHVTWVILGTLDLVSSVNDFISDALECQGLYFGNYGPSPLLVNAMTSLEGVLEISHMTNLKDFAIRSNSGLSGINLPLLPVNQWRIFQIEIMPTAFSSLSDAEIENALTSASLIYFSIRNNNKVWAKDFTNNEIPTGLTGIDVSANNITGNVTITEARNALLSILLGVSSAENNRFANIDISGLHDGALQVLQMAGVLCSNLTLPTTLNSLKQLSAGDNKLDIATNPDLITKINGYTALVTLELSIPNITSVTAIGQNSANGLGLDGDLSGLINLVTLRLSNCKLSGTWVLPNVNNLIAIEIFNNPDLAGLTNFSAHTSLAVIRALDCNSLDLDLSHLTSYTQIMLSHWQNVIIDISGRTSVAFMNTSGGNQINNCPNLTTIILPSGTNNFNFGGQSFVIQDNPLLTTISNLDKVGMSTQVFSCRNNASLDIAFPFNTNFKPNTISVANNAMSQANVDATIFNIHSSAAEFVAGTKSLAIDGAGNAAPSGTYQAPAVPGSPVSAKEAIYELVNTYGWTITYNP